MLKKTTKLIIAILLAAAFVGCPTTESGSGTSSTDSEKITSLQTVINKANDGATINLSEYSDITTYSATINKAVTINGSSTDLNGAILTVEKDATISGITNASVTASSSLGNGSLKISSSSLSSLNIQGGGINSIVVIDVSVDTVTIDKTVDANSTDQYVRFCVDAKTKIGGMNISSSTLIDVTGDVTGNQPKPNADNYHIQFGSANICVAFNTKMGLTTPNDKARASFGGDTSSDADFFIIVNKGQAIVEKFFNQVAEKILGRDKFDPYKEGEADTFDFSMPIEGDTHFIGKPKDKPAPQIWDVTFDANGGAWTDGETPITIKEATTDENGTVVKPADPTMANYDFVYWYLATTTDDVSYDFTKPVDSNITLKAKWAEKPITAGGSITIEDYSFIIDTTHDMTCDLSSDTITFIAKYENGEIITGCAWTYELSYGSHDLSGDYWTAPNYGNEWSIGANAAVTGADGGSVVSKKTLPEGTYQLYVQATDGHFTASNTYQLKIVRKN